MRHEILLLDDDPSLVMAVKALLETKHYGVTASTSPNEIIMEFEKDPHRYSLAIIDFQLPGTNGAQVVESLRKANPDVFVLVFSGDPSRDALRATWKAGALEFIDKMSEPEVLLKAVDRWCKKYEETHRPVSAVIEDSQNGQAIAGLGMVGKSQALAEVARRVAIYEKNQRNVLILGESGVGKELVARKLHSGRGEFRAINCASFRSNPSLLESTLFGHCKGAFTGADKDKAGVFEAVKGGTVFLDEIHHLTPDVQVSLLRALQEKKVARIGSSQETPVEFRLIAAARPDLQTEVEKGNFRLDLFYRIKGATIVIPPLRERKEDIEPLVAEFVKRWNTDTKKSKRVLARTVRYLERYPWPGNVRELENSIYELLDLSPGDKIVPEDLDPKFFESDQEVVSSGEASLRNRLCEVEKAHIKMWMKESKSLREAARKMEISAPSLVRLMRKHGLGQDKSRSNSSH